MLVFLTFVPAVSLCRAQVRPAGLEALVRFVSEDGTVLDSARVTDDSSYARARDIYVRTRAKQAPAVPVRASVRAGASPDGSIESNAQLAERRAQRGATLVRSLAPEIASERIETISVGEDYPRLRSLLADYPAPGAERAITIIDTVPAWVTDASGNVVSSKKKQLMDLEGGRLWNSMAKDLFPELRFAQIDICFGDASEPADATGDLHADALSSAIVIHFPFDDATVHPAYRHNATALIRLDSLLPGESVFVVGKTSIDGPEAYNNKLARRRAEALRSFITTHYPGTEVSLRSEGEDWGAVRAAIAANVRIPSSERTRLQEILDTDLRADRKEKQLSAVSAWSGMRRSVAVDSRVALVSPRFALPQWNIDESLASLQIADLAWTLPTPSIELLPDRLVVPPLGATASARQRRTERSIDPIFGLSTNLIYDFTYVPNYGFTSIPSVSLEYYPRRGHWTVGADVEWPMWKHWDDHRFFQIQNITLWTRRYFKAKDERFRGLYLFAGANAARFGIGWDAKGWEGEGLGASVGIGHKWILGRSRFFLDLGVAAGVFYARYDPYVYGFDDTQRYYYDFAGDLAEFKLRRMALTWFGPTRAYVSLGIDLFNRNKRRAAR